MQAPADELRFDESDVGDDPAVMARTTADLVALAREGDSEAYAELVLRYERQVWAVARSVRLSHADAHDAVQMTWLRLVENLDRLRDPDVVEADITGDLPAAITLLDSIIVSRFAAEWQAVFNFWRGADRPPALPGNHLRVLRARRRSAPPLGAAF